MRDVSCLDLSVRMVKAGYSKTTSLTRVLHERLRWRRGDNSKVREWNEQHHFWHWEDIIFGSSSWTNSHSEGSQGYCLTSVGCVTLAILRDGKKWYQDRENWQKLTVDAVPFGNKYLTQVNCSPSRFALWRRILSDDATQAVAKLQQIFEKWRPPYEFLLYNGKIFRATVMNLWSRCAYRPSGNKTVERNHRAIKSRAMRTRKSPSNIVFWHNMAFQDEDLKSSPVSSVYERIPAPREIWMLRFLMGVLSRAGSYRHNVLMKLPNARWTTRWTEGDVADVPSVTSIEVDDVPLHVADCSFADVGYENSVVTVTVMARTLEESTMP